MQYPTRPAGRTASALRTIGGTAMPVALLLGASLAQAATLTAYTEVMPYDANDQALLDEEGSGICFSYSANGSQTQCQDSWSGVQYNAVASSDYGVLKVYGQSSTSGLTDNGGLAGTPSYVTTLATAIFRDQWTITGEPNGTTGTLQVSFDVHGLYDFSDVGSGLQLGFNMFVFGQGLATRDPQFIPLAGSVGELDYTQTFTTEFTYGTPLDFQISLTGGSVMRELDDGLSYFRESLLDMSNTAVMNAIVVKDSLGNEVPFSLVTTSSAPLFNELAPAVVPVPAALPLFLSGVAGLLALRRRT